MILERVEVSDDMEDRIVTESLKLHLYWQEQYKPINELDEIEVNDTIYALKRVLEFYGGA